MHLSQIGWCMIVSMLGWVTVCPWARQLTTQQLSNSWKKRSGFHSGKLPLSHAGSARLPLARQQGPLQVLVVSVEKKTSINCFLGVTIRTGFCLCHPKVRRILIEGHKHEFFPGNLEFMIQLQLLLMSVTVYTTLTSFFSCGCWLYRNFLYSCKHFFLHLITTFWLLQLIIMDWFLSLVHCFLSLCNLFTNKMAWH